MNGDLKMRAEFDNNVTEIPHIFFSLVSSIVAKIMHNQIRMYSQVYEYIDGRNNRKQSNSFGNERIRLISKITNIFVYISSLS
jgi:hypothetical protein